MGNIGWSGIIIAAVLVVLLFGRGKISSIMGDVAQGIKSFKKGLSDDGNQENKSTNNDTLSSSADNESSKEDSNLENK